jgi:hypothetical protein
VENTKKLLMYDQARADAEAQKKTNQQVIGIKGTAITRAPPRPTLKPIYVQCHCFQQENIQSDGSDQGSSCLINCTDPVSKKRYPCDVNGMPTCPICKCTCQAAYKIGSQQTILSLRQQGKLKDETGRSALFPTVEERKRQANAARTLSDIFKNSIGAAIKNQIHEQLGPLAAIAALGVARHPSASASLQPSSAGLELDSVRLQEDMYTHAARSFVA